jgi:hypothetical protein
VSAAGKSGPARSYWAEIGLLFGTGRPPEQDFKERMNGWKRTFSLSFSNKKIYFFYLLS